MYFLPSLPQPPPHIAMGPDRAGNTGYTAGTLWAIFASMPKRRVMVEGDQWNEILHPPAPPHLLWGESVAPIFQMGVLRLPWVVRWPSSHIRLFSGIKTPSLKLRALEKVTQKTKS